MPYPTKEQILREGFTHRPEVIRTTRRWKNLNWKTAMRAGTVTARIRATAELIQMLAGIYGKPVLIEVFPGRDQSSCYLPEIHTIALNGEPSVITALHELAHHLFGRSELQACRWSVHLFRKVFPVAYSRLEWDGHMLVRANHTQEGGEDA